MAMVASDLIRDANRLAFPTFAAGKVSDATMIALLGNLQTEILMQIQQIAPWLTETETTLGVTRADNLTGYTLLVSPYGHSNFTYHDSTTNRHYPIAIVPDVDQFRSDIEHPAGYIRGDYFIPVDPLGLGWEETTTERPYYWNDDDEIKYNHHFSHAIISDTSDALLVPDFCRGFLVASLATQALLASNADEAKLQVAVQREQTYWNTVLMHFYKATPITSRVGK